MNNSVFGKTMENVGNNRDIKLVTSDKWRKRLVSEPNFHSCKKFLEHLMAIEMKRIRVQMTKPIYLDMSTLDIRKILYYVWTMVSQSMETEQNFVTQILIQRFFWRYFQCCWQMVRGKIMT